MSSAGMMRPYIVAAFFGDQRGGYHLVAAQEGVAPEDATARAVSKYYIDGGKLPLIAMATLALSRETLTNAVAMLDAIDAADKAEDAKVVSLMPPAVAAAVGQPGCYGEPLPMAGPTSDDAPPPAG